MGEMISPKDGGILPLDERLKENLKNLRYDVENQGREKVVLVGDSYKQTVLDDFKWTKLDNMLFGYSVADYGVLMQRRIFIVTPKQKIAELGKYERTAILAAVMDVFLDQAQGMPEIDSPTFDSILITQDFQIGHWIEGNPNLIVPGSPATKWKQ